MMGNRLDILKAVHELGGCATVAQAADAAGVQENTARLVIGGCRTAGLLVRDENCTLTTAPAYRLTFAGLEWLAEQGVPVRGQDDALLAELAAPTYKQGDDPVPFLRMFNSWRRGSTDIAQPDPKSIGDAIDDACGRLDSAAVLVDDYNAAGEAIFAALGEREDLQHAIVPQLAAVLIGERDALRAELMPRICCGDFDNCTTPCVPRAEHFKEQATASIAAVCAGPEPCRHPYHLHPLQQVFDLAIHQLTKGKGERHGGESVPFLAQQWVTLADDYGVGGLFFQANKKLREAQGKQGEERRRELLGAVNYLAMGVLYELAQDGVGAGSNG